MAPGVVAFVVAALLAMTAIGELFLPYTPSETVATVGTAAGPQARPAPAIEDILLAGSEERINRRPLLSPERRARDRFADTRSDAGRNRGLPRLTGTIVGPNGARAIFADADGKPRSAGQGDSVAGLTVQQILSGAVTLTGSDGARVLHPAYSNAQPPANTAGAKGYGR
jgi:hypothetical protein